MWTCRLDPHDKNAFVCGDEVNSIYHYIGDQLVCKNSTSHKGGICDVVFRGEHEMYSGGFDGLVCSYDRRKLGTHVSQADWGGTIWRVVPNLVNKEEIILCNSSENRFQVVDSGLKNELWNSEEGHGSLAYAADWKGTDIVAASFYDKTLCYWRRTL